MTLKELSQLYYLNREIEIDQRRIDELEKQAGLPPCSRLTGMPSAPHSGGSKIEKLVLEIVDLRAVIAAKQIQCIHEQTRLERYISGIPDSLTRQIFQFRFVNGLPWAQVAYSVGGKNTESGVKKICYRYLQTARREEAAARAMLWTVPNQRL